MDKEKLVEFEGYFRSQEFIANALGIRAELEKLNSVKGFCADCQWHECAGKNGGCGCACHCASGG